MLNKFQVRLDDIRTWPTVAISIVLSMVLILFGIYIMIPAEWLSVVVTSVYPSQLVRMFFGLLLMAPGLMVMYLNIKYDLRVYIKEKRTKSTVALFWMGISFLYLCALRIIVIGVFPPIWLLYLALGLITMILWMEGKK